MSHGVAVSTGFAAATEGRVGTLIMHIGDPVITRGSHFFVDESKSRGYHLAAVEVRPELLAEVRRGLRALCRPGQRRLHFTRESESSRRGLTGPLLQQPVVGVVYSAKGMSDKEARTACLRRLVRDAVDGGVALVVLERDESVEAWDRRIIRSELQRVVGDVRYGHQDAHAEPVLWIADALAWAHHAGGDWRRRFAPITRRSVRLIG